MMVVVGENIDPGSKYAEYKPAGGDTAVRSRRPSIYFYSGEEAFFAAINTYLVGTTWTRRQSFKNDTDVNQMCSHQYTTRLKITSGAELERSMDIGAELKGLTIDMGELSKKTFANCETTRSHTSKTLTVNIPPQTNITLYQRRYEFKIAVYFVLDADSRLWKVGTSEGGVERGLTWESTVEIMSSDFLAKDVELDNTAVGTMGMKAVGQVGIERYGGIVDRNHLPMRAKRALLKMKF